MRYHQGYCTGCDILVRFPVYYPGGGRKPVIKRRILIVEDEQDIAEWVAVHLGELWDETGMSNAGQPGRDVGLGAARWSG